MHLKRAQHGGDLSRPVQLRGRPGPFGRVWHRVHDGYLQAGWPDHPLAGPTGRVLLHRVTLYALIGPGEHPCAICGRALSWEVRAPGVGALTTDHVNGDQTDNRPENLRPLCQPCNLSAARRGKPWPLKRRQAEEAKKWVA
jgi:hypothetical protein